MPRISISLCAIATLSLSSTAFAQDTPSATAVALPDAAIESPAGAPARATADILTAGTPVVFLLVEAVNSKTHRKGDWFKIALDRALMLGDHTILPAGTPGMGQVVHSEKSSWGGKAGELIVAARYLDFEGRRLNLRGTKLGIAGETNAGKALAATIAVGFAAALVIRGKNADLPAGLLASAKLAEDFGPAGVSTANADMPIAVDQPMAPTGATAAIDTPITHDEQPEGNGE